jgi:hypothetical protein
VLIANIGKKRVKNVEQRDKEEPDNVTGVRTKPGNALSLASPGFSFARDATQPAEILTLINSKISQTWHVVTKANCYGYKQYTGALVSVLSKLYCCTSSSLLKPVLRPLITGRVLCDMAVLSTLYLAGSLSLSHCTVQIMCKSNCTNESSCLLLLQELEGDIFM